MYSLTTINKQNAAASIAKAYAPIASYNQRPDGTVLLSCTAPGKRRQSKTVAGTEFLPKLEALKTKSGKISDRTLDNLILSFFQPAPVYGLSIRETGVTISKRVGDDAPVFKVLGKAKAKQITAEYHGITIPERHTAKRAEAISRLAESYWTTARRAATV